MPLYEYMCQKCGRRFEKIEKVDAPPTRKCPNCGGRTERLIASPAIHFKGSGWYVTDYARKGATQESKGEKPEAKESKEAKETKETKESPAKKSQKEK